MLKALSLESQMSACTTPKAVRRGSEFECMVYSELMGSYRQGYLKVCVFPRVWTEECNEKYDE